MCDDPTIHRFIMDPCPTCGDTTPLMDDHVKDRLPAHVRYHSKKPVTIMRTDKREAVVTPAACANCHADAYVRYLMAGEAMHAVYERAPNTRDGHAERMAYIDAQPETQERDAAARAWRDLPRLAFREIIHRPHAARKEQCNGKCLNGKTSCSCLCGGFCHGAGVCRCGTPEHKKFLRAAGLA